MKNNMYAHIISQVEKGSIAGRVGIQESDRLLEINGQKVKDIIDYIFLTSDEMVELTIEKKNGAIKKYTIYKEYDESLGILFHNPIIDEAKSCTNKCIFCFIDQLPPNMRETLYYKDDDSRLSFLQGNFITMTNMSDEDFEKIIRYRISPLNISIHTTDPQLRMKMLNNRFAGNIYERLKRLSEADIKVNGQIVLCRNINDKGHLDNTIGDLVKLYPCIESLAVVPVGLSKHRNNLFPLNGYDKSSAKEVILQIEQWQKKLLTSIHTRFVYPSDEFYILAGQPVPDYDSYEGFPQLENGVGLMSKFENELTDALEQLRTDTDYPRKHISIVTGKSAKTFMDDLCKRIESKVSAVSITVHEIRNEFFGESITVAGLLTGKDIINQLKGKKLGEKLLIPACMLKADDTIFLDDVTVADLNRSLEVDIAISKVDGYDFLAKVLE
ncbi:MAG: DUF512 domain-containing protein [Bacillota bacterium]